VVSYYNALYCIVFYCIVLYCIVLYCIGVVVVVMVSMLFSNTTAYITKFLPRQKLENIGGIIIFWGEGGRKNEINKIERFQCMLYVCVGGGGGGGYGGGASGGYGNNERERERESPA